ncbi:Methyl-accepting chemotaxis protein 4 [Tritonibacter multivorans]|uniref:Methyl-accepting chemotaxis protein 4 n=1 Tax=Tritonibacter multivorans TaxID=928856 RepID=A0A0N7LYI5_9RHOB|nr:methyl-accepting chemotaxis protein [Tritonibacter multivorans]MDA7422427.1 methyl-accepting chemotaxis protein [Tritonibacter multivorans]CUH74961.1 Methyl-accepting chemotaxis protein 4 [Tritonibacter multivorans]SFD44267.1 methyl-accepting chemotaxis sensory transducer with Cache sensor [Tritonibacter multivorans]
MRSALFSLSARIYAIVALALVVAVGLTFFMLSSSTKQAYHLRNEEMRKINDSSISLIEDLRARVDAGEMTESDAKAEARRLMEVIRFDGNGYMFAFELDGTFIAHPFKPDWIGENQMHVEDVTGIKIFHEFLDGIEETKTTRITYYFNNPATETIEPKIGFATLYEPWGWVVATGSYVDDIEADLATQRWTSLAGLGIGMILMVVVSTLISRSMMIPLAALRDRMSSMSEGDLTGEIPALADQSEIGKMAGAVEGFRQGLELQAAMEEEQRRQDEERQRVVGILSQRLASLADGDLTVRVKDDLPSEFEQVAHDFNAAVERMSSAVHRIVEGVAGMHNETNALDEAANELGMRTETQAASLEETTAALTELSGSVKTSAEDSRSAARRVEEAGTRTERGAEVVQKTIDAMKGIEESSMQISNITSLIDDIAFQTSLLALNAGVEAARAGEAGRGFAVVAGEVRALAAKSSDAAQEIATLINNASREVQTGVELAQDSGTALTEINDLITSVRGIVNGLADSAREQSVSLSEITTAADQLDKVTQQNAAMFEETSAATQRLRDEAGLLAQDAQKFKLEANDSQEFMKAG